MKDRPNTDDMLHAYVDGELNTRQKTEVKRLLDSDETVTTRVDRIRKTRQLVEALPREEAPADIADQVLGILERKTLLGDRKVSVATEMTFRGRMLRRMRAIAAVLVLFVALGGLIYSIMAPAPGTNTGSGTVAHADYPILQGISSEIQLAGKLTFSGDQDALEQLNQSLQNSGFPELTTVGAQGERYTELQCSRLQLNRLVQDINQNGSTLGETRLTLCALAGQEVASIEIPSIQARQISILLDVADADEGNQLASDMSIENQANPLGHWGANELLPIPTLTENFQSNTVRVVIIWQDTQ